MDNSSSCYKPLNPAECFRQIQGTLNSFEFGIPKPAPLYLRFGHMPIEVENIYTVTNYTLLFCVIGTVLNNVLKTDINTVLIPILIQRFLY